MQSNFFCVRKKITNIKDKLWRFFTSTTILVQSCLPLLLQSTGNMKAHQMGLMLNAQTGGRAEKSGANKFLSPKISSANFIFSFRQIMRFIQFIMNCIIYRWLLPLVHCCYSTGDAIRPFFSHKQQCVVMCCVCFLSSIVRCGFSILFRRLVIRPIITEHKGRSNKYFNDLQLAHYQKRMVAKQMIPIANHQH